MNWNIVGDNLIKRKFKIPVGNISEEIEDYMRAVAASFKMDNVDWEELNRKQLLEDRKLKINKIRNGI